MRFSPNRGFLYPVLGQREYNYPGKSFNVEVSCAVEGEKIKFKVKFDLDVDYINSLIDNGQARCIVWVYCGATSYRKIFKAEPRHLREVTGELITKDLRAQLELHPQIVAVEKLDLLHDDAHPAFGEGPASLSPGNLIAVHKPSFTKIQNLEERSSKSIFQLKCDSEEKQNGWNAEIDPSHPLVFLVANKETHDIFERIRNSDKIQNSHPERAVQTLYLSALVETLHVFLENYDSESLADIDSSTWVGVISSKLKEYDIAVTEDKSGFILETSGSHPKSVLWVAQKLLEFPLVFRHDISEGASA